MSDRPGDELVGLDEADAEPGRDDDPFYDDSLEPGPLDRAFRMDAEELEVLAELERSDTVALAERLAGKGTLASMPGPFRMAEQFSERLR